MEKNKIKKILTNQEGSTLIFALVVLTVMMIIGGALTVVSSADNTESIRQNNGAQAYYLAKSGAVAMGTNIVDNSTSMGASEFQTYLNSIIGHTSDKTYIGPDGGYFQVEITSDETKGLGVISTGTYKNVSRTVTVWLTGSGTSSATITCAAFADSNIELSGSGTITGDTYTNIEDPSSIKATGGSAFNGDVFVSGSSTENWTKVEKYIDDGGEIIPESPKQSYTLPEFPTFPSLPSGGNITTNGWQPTYSDPNYHYGNVTVQGSGSWVINTGNQDCSIVIDNLSMGGNEGLKITGTGKLTIYITNSLSMGGSTKIGDSNHEVVLYMASGSSFSMNSTTIYGSLYAEDLNLSLGGSSRITGHIVTGGTSVSLNGAVQEQIIYAPNASVTLNGGSHVSGAVISKTLRLSGGTSITYNPSQIDEFNNTFSSGSTTYAFDSWE